MMNGIFGKILKLQSHEKHSIKNLEISKTSTQKNNNFDILNS